MSRRIFKSEIEGRPVLAFDTGLDAKAFARARMAQFITDAGSIVYPDGKIESWRPGGVMEQGAGSAATMSVWGPFFPGERLAEIILDRREALDAVRFWLRAALIIEENSAVEAPFPGPAGAFIAMDEQPECPVGTVFFPPARLVKKTLEAEGTEAVLEAERWVHPDLKGAAALSFSAGAMLYRVFCGEAPFPSGPPHGNEDELRQDIREGVFVPPELAAPGLDPSLADLLRRALAGGAGGTGSRPPPDAIADFIGAPASKLSKPVSAWIKALNGEERSKINAERDRYGRKNARKVKTRRFVIRNTAAIAASAVAVVVILLSVRGIIRHRSEMPSTRGMTPVEAAEAYYGSFNNLDHSMMTACVTGRAGKNDIDTVMNFFVINKVRQAYEYIQDSFVPAQEWIEAGQPELADKTVFGITNLKIILFSMDNETAELAADYIRWMPEAYSGNEAAPPEGTAVYDRLILALHKGAWRIREIDRETGPMESLENYAPRFCYP